MNSHNSDEQAFADWELASLLKTWVAEAPKPPAEVRQHIVRHARALRWLPRAEPLLAWVFAFRLLSPEYHRLSSPYDWVTFQATRCRLVL